MNKADQVSSTLHTTGKNRAWLYCRVDSPDAREMEIQEKILRDYAEQQGMDIVSLTAEQGRDLSFMRPGITEISHAVEQGLVDILLVMDITRLGRGVLDTLNYLRWLNDHDVCVTSMNCLDTDSFNALAAENTVLSVIEKCSARSSP